mgnify:CR=1 FL=1
MCWLYSLSYLKVIATVCGEEERGFLEKNYPNIGKRGILVTFSTYPRGGKYKREEVLAFSHSKKIKVARTSVWLKIFILTNFKIRKLSSSYIKLPGKFTPLGYMCTLPLDGCSSSNKNFIFSLISQNCFSENTRLSILWHNMGTITLPALNWKKTFHSMITCNLTMDFHSDFQ